MTPKFFGTSVSSPVISLMPLQHGMVSGLKPVKYGRLYSTAHHGSLLEDSFPNTSNHPCPSLILYTHLEKPWPVLMVQQSARCPFLHVGLVMLENIHAMRCHGVEFTAFSWCAITHFSSDCLYVLTRLWTPWRHERCLSTPVVHPDLSIAAERQQVTWATYSLVCRPSHFPTGHICYHFMVLSTLKQKFNIFCSVIFYA